MQKLLCSLQQQAIDNWETILPYLDQVFEYSADRIDADGALQTLKDGLSEILLVWDPDSFMIYAVMVAEVKIYPKRSVYSIGLCGGGHIHIWKERIWPALKQHARDLGYNQIEIIGRRGWKAFIPGAREIATFYAIDLDTEESSDG